MLDLSVIIPVYNGEKLLKRCLDSVFSQTSSYRYEVLIVDDGSEDASIKIVESYLNTNDNPNLNPNVRLLRQQNGGPAKARNWGMKEAKGRYIALLDADDYWEDSYIEKTVSFLDEHPECVAVSVVCKNIAVSGVSYTPACYDCTLNKGNAYVIDDFYDNWAKECHVGTCSTTMKTEVAQKVLMREDLRISEDYEFWLMIAGFGKWGMILEPLYVSDGTDAITSQKAWLSRMKRRWENAPSLVDWEARIVQQWPSLKDRESFRWAEGRVSRNLTYCQLLSGRERLARQEALTYGAYFIPDPIGKLMNVCKATAISWWLLCRYLRYREYHRF